MASQVDTSSFEAGRACQVDTSSFEAGRACRWQPMAASAFGVRSATYIETKTKEPSADAPYAPAAVDVLKTTAPVFDVAERLGLDADDDLPVPRVLVMNFFVPADPPPVIGGLVTSARLGYALSAAEKPGAGGWQVVARWHLTDAAAAAYAEPETEWTPAMRKWRDWAATCETDAVLSGALKGVARVANEDALPLVVRGYNGVPVRMAKPAVLGPRQGASRLARRRGTLEFGLHFGEDFSHTSNYALHELLPRAPALAVDLAWIVEASTAPELPEGVAACVRVADIDLENAPDLAAWLAAAGS